MPVHAKLGLQIRQVRPAAPDWVDRHRRIVREHYRRSQFAHRVEALWSALHSVADQNLSVIGWTSTLALLRAIGLPLQTQVLLASNLLSESEPFDRATTLQRWCQQTECDAYLTGTGGLNYLDHEAWKKRGLRLIVSPHRPMRYDQMYPGWVANLSTLDLLLCARDPRDLINPSRKEDVL